MSANLILGTVGSIVTLVVLFELLRRKHLREKYAITWVVVSLMTLLVAAFPSILYWLSSLIGVAVPSTVVLHPLPPRVIEIVPDYRGYEYFVLADGRIIIVEPGTLKIVYVLVV